MPRTVPGAIALQSAIRTSAPVACTACASDAAMSPATAGGTIDSTISDSRTSVAQSATSIIPACSARPVGRLAAAFEVRQDPRAMLVQNGADAAAHLARADHAYGAHCHAAAS